MEKEPTYNQIYQLQSHFLGRRFAGASLSDIRLSSEDTGKIGDWLKKKTGMLILSGHPGCGKTHICSAFIAWMFGKVRDIYAMKESDFLEKIRSSLDLKGDYHSEIEYQCDHEFFIFDDLGSTGKGSESGWRQEVLFEMINLRYESKNPTVITTNLTRSEVKNRIGERAYSRLYAAENYKIEMWSYPDLRYPDTQEKK